MRKWLSIVAAALTVAVVVPTLAGAAKTRKTTHKFTDTVLAATVAQSSTPPPPVPGSFAVNAGKDKSSLGSGADVARLTFAAGPSAGTVVATATATFFGKHGSVNMRAKVTSGPPSPGGVVSFTGSGTFTGGTDRYVGATGKFTVTGTTSVAPAAPQSLKFKGKIKY